MRYGAVGGTMGDATRSLPFRRRRVANHQQEDSPSVDDNVVSRIHHKRRRRERKGSDVVTRILNLIQCDAFNVYTNAVRRLSAGTLVPRNLIFIVDIGLVLGGLICVAYWRRDYYLPEDVALLDYHVHSSYRRKVLPPPVNGSWYRRGNSNKGISRPGSGDDDSVDWEDRSHHDETFFVDDSLTEAGSSVSAERQAIREARQWLLETALSSPCQLWMAESTIEPGRYGVFSGSAKRRAGAMVHEPDVVVPLMDRSTDAALRPSPHAWYHVLFTRRDRNMPRHDQYNGPSFLLAMAPELLLQHEFRTDIFAPAGGLGAGLALCSHNKNDRSKPNVVPSFPLYHDDDAVGRAQQASDKRIHRRHSHDGPMADSHSPYYGFGYRASQDIIGGEELVVPCSAADAAESGASKAFDSPRRYGRDIHWLEEHGICLDNLFVDTSTLNEGFSKRPLTGNSVPISDAAPVGRGAFSKRDVLQGQVITATPVALLHRSDLDILQQRFVQPGTMHHDLFFDQDKASITTERTIEFLEGKKRGPQLLLNYCFGHPDSQVLLLPYGAVGVSYINHASGMKANARLEWSYSPSSHIQSFRCHAWTRASSSKVFVNIVATRNITAGEEVFLDYGPNWVSSYEKRVSDWNRREQTETPGRTTAREYKQKGFTDVSSSRLWIRTVAEQKIDPYPDSIRSVCYLPVSDLSRENPQMDGSFSGESPQTNTAHFCLLPCTILERHSSSRNSWNTTQAFYTVGVSRVSNVNFPVEQCSIGGIDWSAKGGFTRIENVPEGFIDLVEAPYQRVPEPFRHEIGAPDNFFPASWLGDDASLSSKANHPVLPLRQIPIIPWDFGNNSLVSAAPPSKRQFFRVLLSSQLRQVMLDFFDRLGLVNILKHVTAAKNPLLPARMSRSIKVMDEVTNNVGEWFLHRSIFDMFGGDVHSISPNDETATADSLQMLSRAGFDPVLAAIGQYFRLDGLSVLNFSLVAFSVTGDSCRHGDVRTGASNRRKSEQSASRAGLVKVIVPLHVSERASASELELLDESGEVARFALERNAATVLRGSSAWYRKYRSNYGSGSETNDNFVMFAEINLVDINKGNIDSLSSEYLEFDHRPGKRNRDILLRGAGRHWSRLGGGVKLPVIHSS
jgi:SET domain